MLVNLIFKRYNYCMENLNNVIAENISNLRKKAGLTQLELAEKLNYSDKAVSKWERGESIPDVVVLKQIADMFGVKVDFLLNKQNPRMIRLTKHISLSSTLITILASIVVWIIATITFVVLELVGVKGAWFCFIIAVPVTLIVMLVLNCIWSKKWITFTIISLLIWSVLATIYIGAIKYNIWLIFLIGIPLQLATIIWAILAEHASRVRAAVDNKIID